MATMTRLAITMSKSVIQWWNQDNSSDLIQVKIDKTWDQKNEAKTTTIIGNPSQKPVNMVIQFDYLTIWPELLDKVYTKKSKYQPSCLNVY
jgi:hypothetical protein